LCLNQPQPPTLEKLVLQTPGNSIASDRVKMKILYVPILKKRNLQDQSQPHKVKLRSNLS